ncbi:MAG: glycosyltransferase family 2 protein [Roseovarius sp.]
MINPVLSIILPAHDEAAYIGACLEALLRTQSDGFAPHLIVVANACNDDTAHIAQSFAERYTQAGWGFEVIDTPTPGKLNALNLGDAGSDADLRAYLDADVIVSPQLMGQIVTALNSDVPRYASGSPVVAPATSTITGAFARIWQRLPFVTTDTPGFGLFAVNAAGRARWGDFPVDIVSDDTFVRLSFAPSERIRVPATYSWPMVEGLRNLVRVRRRQDAGVAEIAERFPDLMKNDQTPGLGASGTVRLALSDPIGFGVYGLVKLLVKTPYAKTTQHWARGR